MGGRTCNSAGSADASDGEGFLAKEPSIQPRASNEHDPCTGHTPPPKQDDRKRVTLAASSMYRVDKTPWLLFV
jgi:hypothetical protein